MVVISQTIGDEFTAPNLPEWDAAQAFAALDTEQIAFTDPDGNCQGYARKRQMAIACSAGTVSLLSMELLITTKRGWL